MTNEQFTHLHNHSYFSLLDGLSSIKGMVSCAANMGYKSLALTDHGSCAGLYQFQKQCKEKGIKPILGMEGYICNDHTNKSKENNSSYHIILLAKNSEGYKNLIRLSSLSNIYGFYYRPRMDFSMLEKHKEGLIVSTACASGEIPSLILSGNEKHAEQIIGKYKDVFGSDFYLEIMIHKYMNDKAQEEKEKKIANYLYKFGNQNGIKVIATQDSHYVHKSDWEIHDVLLSIQTLSHIKNPNRLTFDSQDFYLKPYEEMLDLYKKVPDVLMNTVEISEKIESGLISSSQDLLPNFVLPEGFAKEEDYLKEIVKNGMKEKGLLNKSVYRDRIRMEMNVIISCHYTKYFLILWDIVNFARRQGVRVGIGRGSAVGSLCLYVMDITGLDPIKYDLLFERFLNPERISPPDVDIDFDYDRRDEVYNYIINKYGSERCCQIGTYNRFKARAVIRSAAKALDIGKDWELYLRNKERNSSAKIDMTKNSLNLADAISKQIPFKANMTIESALKKSQEFKESMHQYPKLLECARHIEGTLSSAGVHPAGILVCKDPVVDRIPLRNAKGVICSQYDGPEVEKLGLLKFDLLALKTLTVIDKTIKMIKERHPDKLPKNFDIDKLEPNDPKIFRILNGLNVSINNLGIFQFEGYGISKLLASIRVDTFEDMIVSNALYRPGPLGTGMHDMYADYKHGRKKVEYLHPKMKENLQDTYGIMIFQEQIIKVAKNMAGFTGGQADTLRKGVGKKDKDLISEMKVLFVDGCIKNGIDKEIAQKIFEQIEYFGDYGFNKSHSCAYAFLGYQTCWLKHYFPIEFMCNLLTSELNNNDKNEKLNRYIAAAEKMKIGCASPKINQSGLEFKIITIEKKDGTQEEGLIKPLTFMKGVGDKAVLNIVKNQPYRNLEEFVRKTDSRIVNSRVFSTLVSYGCMDNWKVPHSVLMNQYSEVKKKLEKDKKGKIKQEKNTNKLGGKTLFDEFQSSSQITV